VWDKLYGGTDRDGWPSSIASTNDGGFVIAGSTRSPVSGTISDSSQGSYDWWICKIDSLGNKIWDKRYGGNRDDFLNKIIYIPGEGYMLCGYTFSDNGFDISEPTKGLSDIWVMKLNLAGNKIWEKRYGGDSIESGRDIKTTPFGGFMIAGSTESSASYDVTDSSYGFEDSWILKIDNNGNKLYDKRFGSNASDFANSITFLEDSSLVICGTAGYGHSTTKSDTGRGNDDYWVIKMFPPTMPTSIASYAVIEKSLMLFPNPALSYLNIKLVDFALTSYEIFDPTGRFIRGETFSSKNTSSITLDLTTFSKGIYYLKLVVDGHTITKKIVVM
jgi:hypothetical protein